ncbi:large ribosomal subunit protein mL37 [Parasteatoda tepidariorum]|uniref:large ribosomal subunit protein mL37 n=1 Tax=Parasteatoda tepidariorum TaxID=114398 RepID=UPI001C72904B|nr:39S ribosomal protein L37, mitochondrial [Parasteatoda tepidariorum]
MRLTSIRCQINYHRHVKRIWKRQGRLQAEELIIPPALIEMGVPVLDAKEVLQETKLFKQHKIEVPPIPIPPSVFEKIKCSFVMHFKTKVSESENQTLSLTKTLSYQGLPPQISSLVGHVSLPNQDDLVQTSILQAHVWDADQKKLPKKVDILRPGHIFRRDYGIRNKKKIAATLEKLTNLCDCATGKYPTCFDRAKHIDNSADVTVSRSNEFIRFKLPCDMLLTSREPLKRFASIDEVMSTQKQAVPNIYPIKHTLDLEKIEDTPTVLTSNTSHSGHLHTLFIAQKSFGFWFPKQLLARAIATCFSFSALKARELYGENVSVLPEPVCVQCAYMDLKTFNFIAYQLNTLDLDHNDGVKNQVWVDEPLNLFHAITEKNGIEKYNPVVFSKLLALYLNGLVP